MKLYWIAIVMATVAYSGVVLGQTDDVDRAETAATGSVTATEAADRTEGAGAGRLLSRRFSDYAILLFSKPDDPWTASWNDRGQMAVFSNPTNGVVITSQFLKFPLDPVMEDAVGDRDLYMDIALRKYTSIQLARSNDADVMAQPLDFQSRVLGNHYFRYCPIWGHDRAGGKRIGYFYIMLRGPATKPRFDGDALILTIGHPELMAPSELEQTLKTFDILLQNLSFP